MLTEDEAEAKWCPFARGDMVARERTTAVTDDRALVAGRNGCRCIASACMAWRWFDSEHEFREVWVAMGAACASPAGEGWELADREHADGDHRDCVTWKRVNRGRRGYCGLAAGS